MAPVSQSASSTAPAGEGDHRAAMVEGAYSSVRSSPRALDMMALTMRQATGGVHCHRNSIFDCQPSWKPMLWAIVICGRQVS
jgi:hypothetical protein